MLSLEELKKLDTNSQLQIWQQTAHQLAEIKLREAEFRIHLFGAMFPEAIEGTNTLELGQGYLLKGVNKFNYKVDNTPDMKRSLIKIAIDREDKSFPEKLVKWEPTLSLSNFKSLNEKEHKIFDPYVTKKPGMPDLKILAPGDEGNKRQ